MLIWKYPVLLTFHSEAGVCFAAAAAGSDGDEEEDDDEEEDVMHF